jgi:hypothetical protein
MVLTEAERSAVEAIAEPEVTNSETNRDIFMRTFVGAQLLRGGKIFQRSCSIRLIRLWKSGQGDLTSFDLRKGAAFITPPRQYC